MDRYLAQLLEDLAELAKIPPPAPYIEGIDEPDMEDMRYALEWEQAPLQPVEDILGIGKEMFPPAERLTEAQTESLVEAIEHLWESRNWQPMFVRDELPAPLRYKLLVNKWEEECQYISSGTVYMEFCDYIPKECPYGLQYCFCKEIQDQRGNLPDEGPDWD